MADWPNFDELFSLDVSGEEANLGIKAALETARQMPGALPPSVATITDGVLMPTQSAHLVDTEGQAPADDLQTISPTYVHDGAILELLAADAGRVVTVKHSSEQLNGIALIGGTDKSLSIIAPLRLQRVGNYWKERPLGNRLSDALDGTRKAGDGVGASEWAVGQVNTKAEAAADAAEAADQTAAAAQTIADAALPQADYDADSWSRAKALAFINGSGSIAGANNVSACTRTALGKYTVTLAPGFFTELGKMVALVTPCRDRTSNSPAQINVGIASTSTVYVSIGGTSGALIDAAFSIAVFETS